MSIGLFGLFQNTAMNRIEQLHQFMKDDPTDEFLRYALALEYLKTDPLTAKKEFETLIAQSPEYLPTYYPAAHLMIELGFEADAERLFLKGIEISRKQKNSKTEQELKSAYDMWQFEKG